MNTDAKILNKMLQIRSQGQKLSGRACAYHVQSPVFTPTSRNKQVHISNPTIYKNNYIPQSKGIYSRDARLVLHVKTSYSNISHEIT
jgi:hypothetical protein